MASTPSYADVRRHRRYRTNGEWLKWKKLSVSNQLFYENLRMAFLYKRAYENVCVLGKPGGTMDLLRARFVGLEIAAEANIRPRVLYVHRCSDNAINIQ